MNPAKPQPLRLDPHLHVYPCHCWPRMIAALLRHLGGGPAALTIGILAESKGHHFLEAILNGGAPLTSGALTLSAGPDRASLIIQEQGQRRGYLIAGRQIATAERLELLAPGVDAAIPDGLSTTETITRIRAAGTLPVLSWSPGKWLGARGQVVRHLLETEAPGSLLIGDTALRPAGFAPPSLMRLAAQLGFKRIAGSDPLPLPGEEDQAGRYGTRVAGRLDPDQPAACMRRILMDPTSTFTPIGRRGTVFAGILRWLGNERQRRRNAKG